MRWRKNTFTVHRWVGLVVSLQLLAWSVSGLTFTLLDIDNVRGDWDKADPPPAAVRVDRTSLSPAEALTAAASAGVEPGQVTQVLLRERFDRTVYELFEVSTPLLAVDAATGEVIPTISEADAVAAAQADFVPEAAVASVKLLEGEPPLEFRGGPMPVYQVVLDHPKEPHLYISPVTGQVLKRRNNVWRTFDFLWMLHIMDYGERDNFNHWLLTFMSVLAVVTSATGLAMWAWRVPRRKVRPMPT